MRSIFTILLTAAFIAPCTAAEPKPNTRDDSASEKLGIKLSLQCWTFNKLTFFETVDKAKGLGIKYLEIFPGQKLKPGSDLKISRTMNDETIKEVKAKLEEAGGIKLVAYGVDGIPTDEDGARKTFEWAKKMGLTVLVTETDPNDVIEKMAKEFKIRVALHNHPSTWPPEKVLKAVSKRDPLLGSCSDTGHWMRANRKPIDCLKLLEGRVEHLHFKDLNENGNGHDVPWGTGRGDPAASLAELKRQGYKGYLSIEYEYGSIPQLDENLPKCVKFFDKTMTELAK
ncbi:sugar phosphate isomerase/epimerase [Telmatocola sphagniphila]|uniref:Sugar phosphate isomerase/epimerase n=1 Tax=Telmatocola sphagniphila TaxID=1123043 RepID=A0A8E6F052_9BACT|nr:sugar phosphate isomerase/epimerase [Telmatocola sphagniphila]QVL34151.1 sugar phosphate isomerase/epimerase [Telmatocola sphagniphila]